MIALRLIRWLLSGALVTGAAGVLLAGLAALIPEDKPRGTAAIRFPRCTTGWGSVPRAMGGPGVNLDELRASGEYLCHYGFNKPIREWQTAGPNATGPVEIDAICFMPPFLDWRIFDLDHDGDVDLFDICLMFRWAPPAGSHFPGLVTTYYTEEPKGND